jgi:hypothetical protein
MLAAFCCVLLRCDQHVLLRAHQDHCNISLHSELMCLWWVAMILWSVLSGLLNLQLASQINQVLN